MPISVVFKRFRFFNDLVHTLLLSTKRLIAVVPLAWILLHVGIQDYLKLASGNMTLDFHWTAQHKLYNIAGPLVGCYGE